MFTFCGLFCLWIIFQHLFWCFFFLFSETVYVYFDEYLGTVPSELCSIGGLSILDFSLNENISCYADCLSYVGAVNATSYVGAVNATGSCTSCSESAICSFVGATNIGLVVDYDEWACTSGGVPLSDPCGEVVWDGISCLDGDIISMSLMYKMLTGMV